MVSGGAWAGFIAGLAVLLAVDLRLVGRGGDIGFRTAAVWSAAWVALALVFALVVREWLGREAAAKYLTGYLFEKGLAIENVYFLVAIFAAFGVPAAARGRLLFWTTLAALGLRAVFIAFAAGVALERELASIGASLLLVAGGAAAMRGRPIEIRREASSFERFVRRAIPLSGRFAGNAFFVRGPEGREATLLLPALVAALAADLVVAITAPVVFLASKSAFLVFASTAFAVLGLRALFFLLAPFVHEVARVRRLFGGLLVVVGVESIVARFVKVPPGVALASIVAILSFAVGVLIVRIRREPAAR